jgi:hypothetical protein
VLTDPAIAGPLGGLWLSAVRTDAPTLIVRAALWWRDLGRLGVRVPFFVAHDFGLLVTAPPDQIRIGARPGIDAHLARSPRLRELCAAYQRLVAELATGEIAQSAGALKLGDELVVVLLARVLGALAASTTEGANRATAVTPLPLDPALFHDLARELPRLFAALPRHAEFRFLEALTAGRLRLLTVVDALDVDTLRLLGLFGGDASGAGALAQVDLLAALANPSASDVVNFSLELLPSVLETRKTKATGTHAENGYGGVGRRGTIDSLVLTELFWDDEEFARRMFGGELLYFTREHAPDEAKRLHYVVIDASASMRGDREVFARSLAMALCKKLQLAGEEVWLRFFDSRLYEVQRPRRRTQLPAAWLLGFKGERGRNPARVFAQLATELALLRTREAREPVVHIITHAALHVPRALVAEVRRQAHLFGVFIVPSGGVLDLEWLDLINGYAAVDPAMLHRNARKETATKIVGDMARATATRENGAATRANGAATRENAAGVRAKASAIREKPL